MKTARSYIADTVEAVLETDAWRAVKYMGPKQVTRATRIMYGKGDKKRPSARKVEVYLQIGPPNYREREFIRKCQKAGETFPVKRVQLQFRSQKCR